MEPTIKPHQRPRRRRRCGIALQQIRFICGPTRHCRQFRLLACNRAVVQFRFKFPSRIHGERIQCRRPRARANVSGSSGRAVDPRPGKFPSIESLPARRTLGFTRKCFRGIHRGGRCPAVEWLHRPAIVEPVRATWAMNSPHAKLVIISKDGSVRIMRLTRTASCRMYDLHFDLPLDRGLPVGMDARDRIQSLQLSLTRDSPINRWEILRPRSRRGTP